MPKTDEPVFSLEHYNARRGEVLLHMSHFFLRYLNLLYEAFDGDLAMVIVLGEISHHNVARMFSPSELDNATLRQMADSPAKRMDMDGCNAYSLSCATGIPRETVRRKIVELKKRGWIEDLPGKGLVITPASGEHFGPDFSIKILTEWLKASRMIEPILAAPGAPRSTPAKPASHRSTPPGKISHSQSPASVTQPKKPTTPKKKR